MSYLAPSGTPVRLGDVFASLVARDASLAPFRAALTRATGARSHWPFSSGRAAMTATLSALRQVGDPRRTQVVVAGYTCYSVPAAVMRAGLEPVLCDVEAESAGLSVEELGKLDLSRVLAIVSANLYGIPNELTRLEQLTRSAGVLLFDDAAQAMGATLDGRSVGTFGDVGLYSFDKGKNVPTMQGGVIVSGHAGVTAALDACWKSLPEAATGESLVQIAKLAAYSQLLRPRAYALVQRMPFLGLGLTRFETDYPVTRYSPALAAIATRLIGRLTTFNAARIVNAARIREALAGLKGLRALSVPAQSQPVYLRQPMLAASRELRDRLVAALHADGIGATASYPCALADVAEVRAALRTPASNPQARRIADTILTLPTHAYCPPDIGERIRDIVQRHTD